MNILYNTATWETLLALDLCVPAGQAWEGRGLEGQSFSNQVAFIAANACPETVGLSHDEFELTIRDKIVFFANDVEEACEAFANIENWTSRLTKAGAAAVVMLSLNVNETPGNWYALFNIYSVSSRPTLDPILRSDIPLVPFIHCAITDTHLPFVSSAEALQNVVSFYHRPLVDRLELEVNQSTTLQFNLTVSANPWAELFESSWHIAVFRGILPTLFMIPCLLALYFIWERVRVGWQRATKGGRKKATIDVYLKQIVTPPFLALIIESFGALAIAVYLYLDGMTSNPASPVIPWRIVMISGLNLMGLGSSVLVGMSFHDFCKESSMFNQSSKPFVIRHRTFLFLSAVFLCSFEIIVDFSRTLAPAIWNLANLFSIAVIFTVTSWFAYEAYAFQAAIQTLCASQPSSNVKTDTQSDLVAVVKHTRRFVILTTFSFTVAICLSFVLVFTNYLWHIDTQANTYILWFCTRSCGITSKVILARVAKRHRRNVFGRSKIGVGDKYAVSS